MLETGSEAEPRRASVASAAADGAVDELSSGLAVGSVGDYDILVLGSKVEVVGGHSVRSVQDGPMPGLTVGTVSERGVGDADSAGSSAEVRREVGEYCDELTGVGGTM